LAVIAYFLLLIIAFRFVDPPISTLMAGHMLSGKTLEQKWIPIEKISTHLARAVITSEDSTFCRHNGIDWQEFRKVWSRQKQLSEIRGASTIPMQTMKNLFLWPGRNYIRKFFEFPLAYISSWIWPKKRMLEIYLNIAEWGPGIFGAEAAARHHFKIRASQINSRQAALLAASLPNPIVRRAGKPGPRTRKMAAVVQKRAASSGHITSCIR
ncbi:MAG: monofunctional biosynthetic peptidoglycan transglycosylase, partial [Methyloligellaceae bacterium]